MAVIEGYVEKIVFRNEDNGYTVFQLTSEGDEYTCIGTFQYIGEGECLEAEGEYITHPVYGEQFQVKTYEMKVPDVDIKGPKVDISAPDVDVQGPDWHLKMHLIWQTIDVPW